MFCTHNIQFSERGKRIKQTEREREREIPGPEKPVSLPKLNQETRKF